MLHDTKTELERVNGKVARVEKNYEDLFRVVIDWMSTMLQSATKLLSFYNKEKVQRLSK